MANEIDMLETEAERNAAREIVQILAPLSSAERLEIVASAMKRLAVLDTKSN